MQVTILCPVRHDPTVELAEVQLSSAVAHFAPGGDRVVAVGFTAQYHTVDTTNLGSLVMIVDPPGVLKDDPDWHSLVEQSLAEAVDSNTDIAIAFAQPVTVRLTSHVSTTGSADMHNRVVVVV